MAMHPRTRKVQLAQMEIKGAIFRLADSHGLTYIETVQALADAIDGLSKHALRQERHPKSPDTPADLDE